MAEDAQGEVIVFAEFAEGLRDREGFERIWLLYWFHCTAEPHLRVRRFLDEAKRGLFATRAPCRPNPIGMSSVRLLEVRGNVLRVGEVDIVDGTPLLDIKPFVPQFDCYEVERVGWRDWAQTQRRVADERFR